MVRIVSLSVLLTLIVVLGLTFYKVVAPFILPLFLAAVFAILCQPIYAYFLERTGNRVHVAAGLTTGSVVAIILIPLVVGTVLASLQMFVVATRLSDRNLTHTLREKTAPILQRIADVVNSRMMPEPIDGEYDAAIADPADDGLSMETDITGKSDTDPTSPQSPDGETSSDTGGDAATDGSDNSADVSESNEDETPAESGDVPPVVELIVAAEDSSASAARGPPKPLTAESLRQQLQGWLQVSLAELGNKSLGRGMAGGTFGLLSGSVVAIGAAALAFVIFSVAFYYFLADGTQLVRATERLIPVHVEYQRQVFDQFSRVVRAVVMATFFAALAQSIATVAALWLLGFNHLLIIFAVSLLVSMIPMMGTWLVWLPCAGYLLYQGHWIQATLLCIYGAVFVGLLDNVVRTYVLNSDVKLHPLLALISVLGGLQVMGLWGMFVGPIVASCLHALVKIFNHELSALSQEKFSGIESLVDAPAFESSPPPVVPTPPLPTVAKSVSPGQNDRADHGSEQPPPADV